MSYIDELRERFLLAEQRFGQFTGASKDYRERLMGLMSRIEEEIRCRRDVEQQQAQEIERLSGENEELRTMLMSLLQAVEAGDPNGLDSTLGDMDSKVATLIGEGQGAPAGQYDAGKGDAAESVVEEPPGFDEPPSFEEPVAEDEEVDSLFSDGEMMSDTSDDTGGGDLGEDSLPTDAFVGEDDPIALEEDEAIAAMDDPSIADETDGLQEEPAPSAVVPDAGDEVAASEIAEFFGANSEDDGEMLPAYAHAGFGWEDSLAEDEASTEAPAGPSGDLPDGADELDDDIDAGSIRELLDRVKTEVEGTDAADDFDGDSRTSTDDDAAAAG